ncbi:hypothetical protein D9M71_626510 [compost metagenome]
MGRTDVEAGTAPTAVFGGVGWVYRQRQVNEQLGEEEITACLAIQHQGVFANPAQAGLFGDGFFQHWCAVDKGTETKRADFCLNLVRQLLHAFADQFVVITTQGITRDVGFFRLGEHFRHVGVARQVVHAQRNHAQSAGHQLLRV